MSLGLRCISAVLHGMPNQKKDVEPLAAITRHIEAQRARIARQQFLITRLEVDGDVGVLRSARLLLKDMLDALKRTFAEYTAARQRMDREKHQTEQQKRG